MSLYEIAILVIFFIGLFTTIRWTYILIKAILKDIHTWYKSQFIVPEYRKQYTKYELSELLNKLTHIFPTNEFYDETYHKITHNTYLQTINNTGKYGEYLIYKNLKEQEKSGGKFLFNCYIKKNDTETTELDAILINHHGIFVFESKNYSGWIFGNDEHNTWTQCLKGNRKGYSHKNHFYNPIKQNDTHIEALKKLIGDKYPIHSLIVFSERCTLVELHIKRTDVKVIRRNILKNTVNNIINNNIPTLTNNDIELIYQKLYTSSQVSNTIKMQHIENLKKHA